MPRRLDAPGCRADISMFRKRKCFGVRPVEPCCEANTQVLSCLPRSLGPVRRPALLASLDHTVSRLPADSLVFSALLAQREEEAQTTENQIAEQEKAKEGQTS